MSWAKLKPALLMLSSIGVLTFLFIKMQEHDVKKHHDIILSIQQLTHQDALLNQTILEYRADRFSNYDSITKQNKKITYYLDWLKSEDSGLYGELSSELNKAIDTAEKDFNTKIELIERFKSHNGILKNSMYYLPRAIASSQQDLDTTTYNSDLNHLLREILLFNSWPNQLNEDIASMYIAKLHKSQESKLMEISRHAETTIKHRILIQDVVDELFELPTTENVDEIYKLYSEHNAEIIESASRYRIAMYAMALILLFYMLQIFNTLRRTMQNLEDSLSEVAFQKDALDEHSIVVSMSPDGIVNYVNDKFVETSKYSKQEIVGKSWSILDPDTYANSNFNDMWNALTDGNCWTGEIKHKKKQGGYYWADATIVPFIDKMNNPIRYVALLTDITERKRNEERIYNLAHYDGLTKLPNRAFFLNNLDESLTLATNTNNKLAVLFLDLDNFKMINDTMGHASGDELLILVANHLRSSIRENDNVARLGGDEFTIILRDIESHDDIEAAVERIMSITKRSVTIGKKDIVISPSIGISVFPDDAIDKDTLLKNADIAMYQAKADGKNNYKFFSEELKMKNSERHLLENELRVALKRNQFELYYQPQITAASGEICAVEALIRWNHPEKGLIPPDNFIPILEDSGLIVDVGKWVLMKACAQLVAWKAQGYNLRMAVNISAHQLRDDHLVGLIKQLLKLQPIDPKDLELELTESSFLHNTDYSLSVLTALSDLGISLSLDDFGTGYSSLSHLKKLPIDSLKIDRSFVNDLPHDENDLAIATTIIAMAKNLNHSVVAEGVETAEQFAFLNDCGVEYLQGYYFSKPLPAAEIQATLEENRVIHSDNSVVRLAR